MTERSVAALRRGLHHKIDAVAAGLADLMESQAEPDRKLLNATSTSFAPQSGPSGSSRST